jgi:hypothetical protein
MIQEKLLFWRKPKMLKEGVDYYFVDFKDSEITGVQILKGEYVDVVYHYGGVRIDHSSAIPRMQFGYTIVHAGKHDIDVLQNDEELHTMMGDILTQILTKQIDEQTRKNDTEEPNL